MSMPPAWWTTSSREGISVTHIAFHGTSGWFENERGCTSCVGVYPGDDDVVLFDLGTGVRNIETAAIHDKKLTVVLTHLHLDHCYGLHMLPMFKPSSLTILIHADLKKHLELLFDAPFTRPYHSLDFPVELRPVRNEVIEYSAFSLTTRELKHNTPVIGARLTIHDTSIAYCVDTTLCEGLLDLARDADTLIIETAPPPGKATNGFHLTLGQLQGVLSRCRAGRVVVTHFGARKFPDPQLKQDMRALLSRSHPNIAMAHDGLCVAL